MGLDCDTYSNAALDAGLTPVLVAALKEQAIVRANAVRLIHTLLYSRVNFEQVCSCAMSTSCVCT